MANTQSKTPVIVFRIAGVAYGGLIVYLLITQPMGGWALLGASALVFILSWFLRGGFVMRRFFLYYSFVVVIAYLGIRFLLSP